MNSFLICHRGALGDFLLTWPALYLLKEILPDYHFLGLGRPEYMRLAISFGLLDSCFDMESTRMLDFFCGRAIPPEIASPDGGVLWLSDAQKIVNLLQKTAPLPVISIPPFPTRRIHISRYYCSSIQSRFPINIPKNLSECFPLKKTKGDYALIHPGSGSSAKNFEPKLYCDLADELRRCGHQRIGFIVGPAEENIDKSYFGGEWIEMPENIEALANLLAGAELYIGNDSGVSHLSGILGIPTITLYKITDPKIWGTLGRKVTHIEALNEESAFRKIRNALKQIKNP